MSKLKLHALEISGFKSFLDPVELRFADGITAIVGPNGCGKSNLTDAITWVLGEQSAKSLRGAKMEDVIFSGSDKRKPVGMAQVELTFEADGGFEMAQDGLIRIGRQVVRDGPSRYRLNGRTVRLKEIKDLLMDTGLGTRAYSVIEQGKIGMILSSKPQERRRLLEEAAGVTRYKARKRVAEVKLEETSANLLRLDDIISEAQRAVRSLKRQASAARRFKIKQEEADSLLRQVLLGRYGRLRERLDGLDLQVLDATRREAESTAELARDEAELVARRERLDELSAALGARHQTLADLGATIEGRQEFLRGSSQRRSEMDERLRRGRDEAELRRQQAAELQQSIGSLDERTSEVMAQRDDAARQVAADQERLGALERKVTAAQASLEGLRRDQMRSMGELDKVRSRLQRTTTDLEKLAYRDRFLDDERERLDGRLADSDRSLAEIDEEIAEARLALDDAEERRQRLDADLDRVLRSEADTIERRRELESELRGLEQRRKILAELSQQHAHTRRALEQALGDLGLEAPRFLADTLRARPQWAEAIDHFLGALADAVLLDSDADALGHARSLAARETAGIFLRPLADGAAGDEIVDPAIVGSLAGALDLTPELARALPPAYLVDGADDAARLSAQHPGVAFLTRQRLWMRGGEVRVESEAAAPGILARSSELEALGDQIPQLEDRIEAARAEIASLVEERTGLAGDKRRATDEVADQQRRIAVAQARRQDVETRRGKLTAERGGIAQERDNIARETETKSGERTSLAADLERGERAHSERDAAMQEAADAVESARAERETARADGADRRGRLALLEQRLEEQNREALRVRRQITFSAEQLEIWAREDASLEERKGELDEAMQTAEWELQQALETRSEAQEAVLEAQQQLDGEREAQRQLEERVVERRDERDGVRQTLEALRIDQAGLRQEAEHVAAQYREAFVMLIPGTAAPAEPPPSPAELDADRPTDDAPIEDRTLPADSLATDRQPADPSAQLASDADIDAAEADDTATGEAPVQAELPSPPPAWQVDDVEVPLLDAAELSRLEADLARARAALDRIGPVNLLADEEYDQQVERLDHLEVQRGDVASSVRQLRATIQEINATSSERFRATFDEVNRTFGRTFAQLFRGGEASMSLYDETDVLETGIEIVARPPGKRLQNIQLLSGGEKALTAVALLFALFETKPSPFCILDEVDAPLDDANVLRFVDVLGEMAQETQFLVVTHNKLTMETASRLYGVTMEEKGVSKLVQAEMDRLHPAAASARSEPPLVPA